MWPKRSEEETTQKLQRRGQKKSAINKIDQNILIESKTCRNNLAIVLIDNKKAFDMAPQSWIINCLKMFKISDEVMNFIEKTMKT